MFTNEAALFKGRIASYFASVRWLMLASIVFTIGCESSRLPEIDTSHVELPSEIQSVLDTPHTLEFLSLNPDDLDPKPNFFHKHEVLGRAPVDAAMEAKIVHGLKACYVSTPNEVPACFSPRHGLHIESADDVVDILICFECRQLQVIKNDRAKKGFNTISDVPRPIFEQIAKDLKLRLPRPAR